MITSQGYSQDFERAGMDWEKQRTEIYEDPTQRHSQDFEGAGKNWLKQGTDIYEDPIMGSERKKVWNLLLNMPLKLFISPPPPPPVYAPDSCNENTEVKGN